jgi:nucleoid-associated protein YgaU
LKSACAVLAWSILVVLVAAGMKGSVPPAQANIRIASSTTQVTLASTLSVAAAPKTVARPVSRYAVRPGDTLSGIAARFAVRGGWPALYAANRPRIGPDPNVIRPGTILVLPGWMAPARYMVVAGDTLAGIAARLAVRGGWPALYAANRKVIGPDPGMIRPGTVLAIPRPAAPRAPASGPGRRVPPPPPPPASAGSGHRPVPVTAPAAPGMPQWLKALLLAAGLLIGAVFLGGPVLLARRRQAARAARPGAAGFGPAPGAGKAHIVVADHDRLVVTCSRPDDTVYVLRPPGADPREILRVARLVLPEVPYGELADQLGVPASWPVGYRVPARSACVVFAWSILMIMAVAAVMAGPARPVQADTRAASSTEVTLTSTLSAAAAPGTAARPAARYVVQPGDTLSGIAARFAVRGGWPALYAANRPLIGPGPDVIRPGTVLVLPGQRAPARYRVVPGDTLAGIAAALAVRGGWPALYAANRAVIGPDPDVVRAGAVLTVPRPAAPSPAAPRPAGRPVPPPSAPAGNGHRPLPGRAGAPAAAGMPQWLKALLLAAGLLSGAVFLGGPVLLARRRRRAAARAARPDHVGAGRGRDRGSRYRGVAAAVRPVAVAARVHPAGVAVPCVVLAAGIVLFTLVKSATVPPPGGSGPGSVSAVRPGTGQPQHRLRLRPPGPPGQPALPGGPGQDARRLTCRPERIAPPLPVPAAVSPAGPGRAPQASRNQSSRLSGGQVCEVRQMLSSAAAAAAGSGGAGQ